MPSTRALSSQPLTLNPSFDIHHKILTSKLSQLREPVNQVQTLRLFRARGPPPRFREARYDTSDVGFLPHEEGCDGLINPDVSNDTALEGPV